jgi:DNA polymerase-2
MTIQRGFIVYYDYTTIQEETYVELFGRLESGESFLTLNKISPYFFVKKTEEKQIQRIIKENQYGEIKIEKTPQKTFQDEEVIKIILKNQETLNKLVKDIHSEAIETYEADIRPQTRFIIDSDILGTINIQGEYEISEKINRIYKNPEITKGDFQAVEKIKLKIASIDIESSKKGNLFCIGVYSENFKKVFMVTKNKIENVTPCQNEEECLEKFKKAIVELDPDIITGWNVIDFDFNYLKTLFDKYRIPFDIGRTNQNARLRIEANFFKNSSLDIPGRVVLDGLNFIKDPFIQEAPTIKNIKFENYTLEEVSSAIIKKTKLIKGKNRHHEIEELFHGNLEEQQKLAEYNLRDCELVYDILMHTKMIDLSIERSELTGLALDRLGGSIASFDSLYIRQARKRNLVSPTTKFSNKEERIKGGFVMSPKPGLYDNVLVLDFKSLYPSIIKTFNIDPASFIEHPKKDEKNIIISPNNATFRNTNGILPEIIAKLHLAREKAKKEKREFSSYAIKIIMNSFFGVLASPNCRYFDLRIANAITNFGQEIIKLTTKQIEKLGYHVIYGDTDSVFVETKLNKEKAEKLGPEISEKIDEFYRDYVEKNYNRQSYLDLEFDKLFLSLIMPQVRVHEKKTRTQQEETEKEAKGAKKRYAGLVEEKDEDNNIKEILDIVGLEAIRGDWTEAAGDFQKQLLIRVFKKQEILPFIRDYVKLIRQGKLDSKLIYRKSIRKELGEYTKTTPPHVKAARQLENLESNVIEYYITLEGPEPIQKLKHKLDYEHYIEKQIKPIAKTILETLGINFEEALSQIKQKTLF